MDRKWNWEDEEGTWILREGVMDGEIGGGMVVLWGVGISEQAAPQGGISRR